MGDAKGDACGGAQPPPPLKIKKNVVSFFLPYWDLFLYVESLLSSFLEAIFSIIFSIHFIHALSENDNSKRKIH